MVGARSVAGHVPRSLFGAAIDHGRWPVLRRRCPVLLAPEPPSRRTFGRRADVRRTGHLALLRTIADLRLGNLSALLCKEAIADCGSYHPVRSGVLPRTDRDYRKAGRGHRTRSHDDPALL